MDRLPVVSSHLRQLEKRASADRTVRELRKQRLQQFARPQGVPGDLVELRRRDGARPSSLRRPRRRQPRRLLEQLSSGLGRATARRGTSSKLDRPGDLAVRRLGSACQVICALLLIVNHLSEQAVKLAPPRPDAPSNTRWTPAAGA